MKFSLIFNFNFQLLTIILGLIYLSSNYGVYCRPEILTSSSSSLQNPPVIGAYQKNFAGRIVKVFSERSNSDATLSELHVADNIWEGKSIQLDCNASYPVEWTYSGTGSPPVHVETFRQASDLYNPETYSFSSTVTFTHTTERQTGNYSCQSIENPNLLTYIYLFVPGNRTFFADAGPEKNITITPTLNDSWVTLPCAVADKETKVTLYKSLPTGDEEELKLSVGDSLIFDPMYGFHLKWRAGGMKDPWGNYFCQANFLDREEKLHFRLLDPSVASKTPILPNEDQEIKFSYDEQEHRILCCSSDSQVRPTMVHSRCESISDCKLRRLYVEDKACQPKCEHSYTNVGSNCEAYELGNYTDTGIMECSLNDAVKKYYQFSYMDGNLISDFSKTPALEKILTVFKETPSKNGTGTYTCHANNFFFSHGLKWGLQKSNGTLEIVTEERFPEKHEIDVNEAENTAVFCFAPVWNSATEWKNVSVPVKV